MKYLFIIIIFLLQIAYFLIERIVKLFWIIIAFLWELKPLTDGYGFWYKVYFFIPAFPLFFYKEFETIKEYFQYLFDDNECAQS